MKLSIKLVFSLAVLFALVLTAVTYISFVSITKASTVEGSDYYSTTTTSSFASATSIKQLKGGFGSLGSIIVSSSSPVVANYPQIVIYDATSTMATATAKVLFKLGGSNQTAGTYTVDAIATYGISIEIPTGYNGNATVTWR